VLVEASRKQLNNCITEYRFAVAQRNASPEFLASLEEDLQRAKRVAITAKGASRLALDRMRSSSFAQLGSLKPLSSPPSDENSEEKVNLKAPSEPAQQHRLPGSGLLPADLTFIVADWVHQTTNCYLEAINECRETGTLPLVREPRVPVHGVLAQRRWMTEWLTTPLREDRQSNSGADFVGLLKRSLPYVPGVGAALGFVVTLALTS